MLNPGTTWRVWNPSSQAWRKASSRKTKKIRQLVLNYKSQTRWIMCEGRSLRWSVVTSKTRIKWGTDSRSSSLSRKGNKTMRMMITSIKSHRYASSRNWQGKSAYKPKPFALSTMLGTLNQAALTSLSMRNSKPSRSSRNWGTIKSSPRRDCRRNHKLNSMRMSRAR